MTAYELADELLRDNTQLTVASAHMLRQQADRIAELENEAEDWEKATKWMEMVRQVPTKPLSNAELDIEIVKLVQGKHATMRDMLRAIEERHGIK